MLCLSRRLAIPALLVLTIACNSGRRSPSGFRLPADGDIERGKAAFLALGCYSCHEVSGADLPRPAVKPPVPVVLGGEVTRELTDGYLVTSLINPSHKLAPYRKDLITVAGKSRMPEYAEEMTVRQLTDLVAFLQSRYTVRQLAAKYPRYY